MAHSRRLIWKRPTIADEVAIMLQVPMRVSPDTSLPLDSGWNLEPSRLLV